MCRYCGKIESCLIVQQNEVSKMLLALLRLEFSLHGEALEHRLTPGLCWRLNQCVSDTNYTNASYSPHPSSELAYWQRST
jgi:hypothetical protein